MACCCCRSAVLLLFVPFFLLLSSYAVKGQDNNIKLTEENWLQITEGEWMIKFFAPWCPACRNVAQNWNDFADEAVKLGVKVAEVDVTKASGVSGRFMISSLPTFYHVVDGEFRKYSGGRSVKDFVHFIKEKKWEEIEPVSSWKSPTSFVMKCMGYVIKLSTNFRDAHVLLTETYGLPAWGSYAVFGLGTVVVGLLLGVLIVVITDSLYKPDYQGPPPDQRPPPAEPQPDEAAQLNKENKGEEEVEKKTEETTEDVKPENGEEQIPESNKIEEEKVSLGKQDGTTDEADAAITEDNVKVDEKNDDEDDNEEDVVVVDKEEEDGEVEKGDEEDETGTQVVDEVIQDKEEDEDHEHTEVRKRKPKLSSGD